MESRFHTGRRLARLVAERTGRPELGHDADVVARVLPFKVSAHVADVLVDWGRAPDDPLYRLVMPHRDMLSPADFAAVEAALPDEERLRRVVTGIRERLAPPPEDPPGGEDGQGLEHVYPDTLLVLPRQGQTCHSHCGYCFRWPQFTGEPGGRRAVHGPGAMCAHLDRHPAVTDVLLTGGDPLVMRADVLADYLAPLTGRRHGHVRTVRIGTKAVSFAPERFLTAPDADDLLRLLDGVVRSGRHLALMLHVTHPRELEPGPARRALRRLHATGAVLRTQAPVVRHVNDDPAVWARMWQEQVELGLVPYDMFVARDTGPRRYYGLPLVRVLGVYTEACRRVSGLARTARGPVMATGLGKLVVDGIARLPDGPAFALRALRTRDPELTGTLAHARFDPTARWWSDLVPYGEHDRCLIPDRGPGP
ncbi:KamA family radical SAM protein [Streptomyces filamentosus]|uniref:KamA family radical SAM protein n=1 Tax=Streptomyces filamentosus TaxID=67294 RepID=UPI00167399F9|nr:lysine 2,3-aminomutase [Streptomyces filamentosus]